MPTRSELLLHLSFLVLFGVVAAVPPASARHAQALHRFDGSKGMFPYFGNLIVDAAGNLYGTTYYGGNGGGHCGYGCGVAFKLTRESNGGWVETVLHEFQDDSQDGYWPAAGLTLDAAGNLYGTTTEGGYWGFGIAFMLTPQSDGTYSETVIHSFCSVYDCADGEWPYSGLVFDAAGNLYGTTFQGGANTVSGTAFRLSPGEGGNWTDTVLFSFNDDGGPYGSGLILDKAGNVYGTTSSWYGGCSFGGSVFELKPNASDQWIESVLHTFQNNGKDGYCPTASLIFDPEGNLYGTTSYGGTHDAGTVFELIPGKDNQWTEKILHSFNINDGAQPFGSLTRDAAGSLYGTLAYGGKYGLGSVFKLTPTKLGKGRGSVSEEILLNLRGKDGISPFSGVVIGPTGHFYGTTYYGGNLSDCDYTGCGTVFEITP